MLQELLHQDKLLVLAELEFQVQLQVLQLQELVEVVEVVILNGIMVAQVEVEREERKLQQKLQQEELQILVEVEVVLETFHVLEVQ
jgi:hypothetical protein